MTLKLWRNKKDDWSAEIKRGKLKKAFICKMTMKEITEYLKAMQRGY
jgi:hypothetical protein